MGRVGGAAMRLSINKSNHLARRKVVYPCNRCDGIASTSKGICITSNRVFICSGCNGRREHVRVRRHPVSLTVNKERGSVLFIAASDSFCKVGVH